MRIRHIETLPDWPGIDIGENVCEFQPARPRWARQSLSEDASNRRENHFSLMQGNEQAGEAQAPWEDCVLGVGYAELYGSGLSTHCGYGPPPSPPLPFPGR